MAEIKPSEVDPIINIVTRMYIVVNAVRLGWSVEIQEGQIILSKNSNKLTKTDNDTSDLIKELIKNY